MSRYTKLIRRLIENELEERAIRGEFKKIKDKRRQKIIKGQSMSIEQKRKIDSFYKENYGKKIPYDWHREFTAFTGKFDHRYIPEFLFLPIIEKMFNDRNASSTTSDKTLLPIFTNNLDYVYTPKIIACQTNELNLKFNNKLISFNELLKNIKNLGKCFIKPARDTNSGSGCKILNIIDGIDVISNKNISDIIKNYNNNFIIQELIENSESVKKLHPNSLNTFRVITYMLNNKINVAPVALRIGSNGSSVDNAHSGGMFIHVVDNGKDAVLDKYAFTEFKDVFERHPITSIQFQNYKIFNFEKIIIAAKRLHEERFPMLGMISFDLTLDRNENAVLIEINSIGQTCWFPQEASGEALFGDDTAQILQMTKEYRNRRK